jgi:2-iminobutanoate/2-iminopropanoate deaminase
MTRTPISTENAPQPAGQYSQGIAWDGLVYTAGQVGIDPSTGKVVHGGIREQTRQALTNVRTILEAGGTSLESVVKTTCFLASIGDFAAFNDVYREFFPTDPPARSTVQAGLPGSYLVEIEALATRG